MRDFHQQTLRFRHSSTQRGYSTRVQWNSRILLHVNKASDFPPSASLSRYAERHNGRTTMTLKCTLIGATAIAIALTSFDLRPAAAAPQGGPAIAKQTVGADELSAARKKRRGYRGNPGVPLAAFGAIAGTIGAIAATNARRDYYERRYYAPGYYDEPIYGYYSGGAAHGYVGPRAYHYQQAPVYQRHYGAPTYQGRGWGNYHAPDHNVPGHGTGQQGIPPPVVAQPPSGGAI
jgi:hypothetical protein